MKTKTKLMLLLTTLFIASTIAFTQQPNCDQVVVDDAGVFDRAQVYQAAQNLIAKGADVRIWAVVPTSDLDGYEKNIERNCASWRAPNGDRKSTLIALMVSPSTHKMGMYYGAAWHHALDDHWNRIKQDYMSPNFKAGNFTNGMVAAANQFVARIVASQDEALHPAVSNTVNQATDFSGLWSVLFWTLLAAVILICLAWLVSEISKRKKAKINTKVAQSSAIAYRDQCVELLSLLKSKGKVTEYDNFSSRYSTIASQLRYDPSQNDLAKEEYIAMADVYSRLVSQMSAVVYPNTPSAKAKQESYPPIPVPIPPPPASAKPQPPTTKVIKKTVVVHERDNSSNFTDGLIVGSLLSDRGEREERHRDTYEPSRSSSDDSSSSSGGSSDWGSSDSGSGGSSDFGGGDSGGGGSSDF
jgi:uncharacterized membrane protein YgcG